MYFNEEIKKLTLWEPPASLQKKGTLGPITDNNYHIYSHIDLFPTKTWLEAGGRHINAA